MVPMTSAPPTSRPAPPTTSPAPDAGPSGVSPSAGAAGRAPHATAILAIVLVGYFMVILDNSVVITGLPHLRAELGLSAGTAAWVQDAYLLTFGGLLLLGARAGDLLGRRRTFVLGVVLFSLASVAVGLAPTGGLLVGARAVQGAGAAVLAPSTLALLTATFREGPERTRATSAYGAVAGIGASVGLVLGGFLADALSWRVGFLVNLPVGVVMLVAGLRVLPRTPRTPGRFDVPGAVLATAGPAALVVALVEAADAGWGSPTAVGALVLGLLLLGLLVAVERRAAQPVLPLRLFADRERVGAYVTRALFIGAMMGFFLLTSQYLQDVRGASALAAGLAFFPMTAVNFVVALAVPRLQRRVAAPVLLVAGLVLAVAGTAWLGLLDDATPYAVGVALPMVLLGAGQGLAFGPLTASAVVRVDPADAGAASGALNTVHQLGAALGMSLVLATTSTYAGAMRAGAVLLGAALVAAVVLVLPASRAAARR